MLSAKDVKIIVLWLNITEWGNWFLSLNNCCRFVEIFKHVCKFSSTSCTKRGVYFTSAWIADISGLLLLIESAGSEDMWFPRLHQTRPFTFCLVHLGQHSAGSHCHVRSLTTSMLGKPRRGIDCSPWEGAIQDASLNLQMTQCQWLPDENHQAEPFPNAWTTKSGAKSDSFISLSFRKCGKAVVTRTSWL